MKVAYKKMCIRDSLYAEPYTDISFHSFKLSGNNDLDDNLYLFLNDKYNEGNKILDYLNEFSSNANFSIEEIIIRLTTMNVNIPYHILGQLSNEELQNIKVKEAIVNCVENIAFHKHFDACDQYQYGQYGGEDVAEWRLSQSLQFKEIWESLPDKVREYCNDELERAWLQIPNTKNILNGEVEFLQES